MSTTERRTRLTRDVRREQIVEAAARVLIGRDPTEVTFEEIADAAGVSRALVYNYFGDRHGLLAAVYRRRLKGLQTRLLAVFDGKENFEDAVAKVVRAHFTYAKEDPESYRAAAGEGLLMRYPDVVNERIEVVARSLGGGPEARLLAHATVSMCEATVLAWLDDDELPFERAVSVVTELVWSGLSSIGDMGLSPQYPFEAAPLT